MASERKKEGGGEEGEGRGWGERDWERLIDLCGRRLCQGACQGVTHAPQICVMQGLLPPSPPCLVRDRSSGWCVSKLCFSLSFIDSENSKVVSLTQYNKVLSFKISQCQDEYGLLK